MKSFESFFILLNVFILVVTFIKYKQLARGEIHKFVDIPIGVFVAFFPLNTLGNLFDQ